MKKHVFVFVMCIIFIASLHVVLAMDYPPEPPPSPRDGDVADIIPLFTLEEETFLRIEKEKEQTSRHVLGLDAVSELTQSILDDAYRLKGEEIDAWTDQRFVELRIDNLAQRCDAFVVREMIESLTSLLERMEEEKLLDDDHGQINEIVEFYKLHLLPFQIRHAYQFLSRHFCAAAADYGAGFDDAL